MTAKSGFHPPRGVSIMFSRPPIHQFVRLLAEDDPPLRSRGERRPKRRPRDTEDAGAGDDLDSHRVVGGPLLDDVLKVFYRPAHVGDNGLGINSWQAPPPVCHSNSEATR